MRKYIAIVAAVAVAGLASAGLDMFTAKNFTTLLTPAVVTASVPYTNSAVTGTSVAGLPGNGALAFVYSCTNGATSTMSFSVSSCATTNGTYATYTNASGVSAWVYTNAAGVAVIPFRPNNVSAYIRVTATPSAAAAGGLAGALLITE